MRTLIAKIRESRQVKRYITVRAEREDSFNKILERTNSVVKYNYVETPLVVDGQYGLEYTITLVSKKARKAFNKSLRQEYKKYLV